MDETTAYLKVGGSCKVKDRIYFLNMTFNGIFYLDLHDLSVHFEHQFSGIPAEMIRLAGTSIFYENTIYFFPSMANFIMQYDLEKCQEKIIDIEDFDEENFLIMGCVQIQNKVYMFPHNLGKGVFVFDMKSHVVERDKELSSLFASGFYCGITFLVRNNSVMLSSFNGNEIVEVDLVSKKIIYSKEFEDGLKIYSVYFDGLDYWILQMNSPVIYEWNREQDTVQLYKNESILQEETREGVYSNLIFLKDEILVLPLHLREIFKINRDTKMIERYKELPKEFEYADNRFRFCAICFQYTLLEDKVLIYSDSGNMLLVYDLVTGELSGKKLLISERGLPNLREILKKIMYTGKVYVENDNVESLKNLTNVLEMSIKKRRADEQVNVGQLIYEGSQK